MIFRRHPTRETLLEMASNRLPSDERQRVELHVDDCDTCRQKLDEMRVSCAVFENLSEAGIAEVMWLSRQGSMARSAVRPPRSYGRFAMAGGGLVTALCVVGLLIFVVPQTRVEAKANALLEESIKAQPGDGTISHYRMKVGTTACPREHEFATVALTVSSCSAASKRLQQTAWANGSPLSAKTFQSWRATQAHSKDRVTEDATGWKIETTSEDGVIRQAMLQLRSSDHRVAELVLQFRDIAEETRFVEDNEPVTDVIAAGGPVRGAMQGTTEGDNPADVLEVQAWSALHLALVDSAWDASVMRDGQSIRVSVAADDEGKRQQVLRAFQDVSKQNVHLQAAPGAVRDMPKRAFSGDGPALAERWVTEHYPDSAKQTAFKSEGTRLSRDVLGRALWIERMESRRSALQACSCAESFNALIAAERLDLVKSEMRLAEALQPLAGQDAAVRPLNAAEARKLDLSVQELLISSDHVADDGAMQQQLSSVQKLLQVSSK